MKIYIKTPLYKNSKYIAHLLEHTIGNGGEIKNFFELISDSHMVTFSDYIFLDFPNFLELDKIKKYIFKIPSKNQINYEKKVLKDELSNTPFKLKIEQKIGKILFGKDLNIVKNQRFSYEEILNYHKKYFHDKNIIISDDNYNILQDNKFNLDFEKKLDFEEKKFYFKVNNFPCFIYVKKIENYLDYYLFFFLEFFYNELASYQIRFTEGYYYYDHEAYSYRLHDANIFCLTCEILDFSEDFFNLAKQRFLKIVEKGYGKKGKIICKMIYGEKADLKEIKDFFKNFNSDDLRKLIGKESDYKNIK